jgi:DNA-directed RNA polymerase subunit M/transcription elongation factor TFIIS
VTPVVEADDLTQAHSFEGSNMADDEKVKCPKCGSEQIHAEKRGWSVWTGLIGSGKIVLTCLKCGNKFQPGER